MTISNTKQHANALPPSTPMAAAPRRGLARYESALNTSAELSSAWLPTLFGEFQIRVCEDDDGREHVVLQMADPASSGQPALVRIHSECMTSEVFGSLLCDCREQLHGALHQIKEHGSGLLIYLRQEGRNIGLANKIRAYALQQQGFDTVDANLELGLPVDSRSFRLAAEILGEQSITSVRLITNNPEKVAELEAAGIQVVERIHLAIEDRLENRRYLQAKRERLGHLSRTRP